MLRIPFKQKPIKLFAKFFAISFLAISTAQASGTGSIINLRGGYLSPKHSLYVSLASLPGYQSYKITCEIKNSTCDLNDPTKKCTIGYLKTNGGIMSDTNTVGDRFYIYYPKHIYSKQVKVYEPGQKGLVWFTNVGDIALSIENCTAEYTN